MRRRGFLGVLGSAVVAWSVAARAQERVRVRRIGVIMIYAEADPEGQAPLSALRDRLHKLGWTEGSNIQIEVRWAAGKSDQMRADAVEFVSMPVEVIVANSTPLIGMLKSLTQTIPIVFAQVADPVSSGFVTNYARPCFDLNEGDESKKLKTDASTRLVPMHSQLIALGFVDYVQTVRDTGVKKLFPKFEYCPKNGWGRSLGRWFNEQFLVKVGMKAEGLSFHSFRHTVVTGLIHADVELPLVQTLVGHERQGVTHQHYFRSGFKIAQLRDALEKLEYSAPPVIA